MVRIELSPCFFEPKLGRVPLVSYPTKSMKQLLVEFLSGCSPLKSASGQAKILRLSKTLDDKHPVI